MQYRIIENKIFEKGKLSQVNYEVQEKYSFFFSLIKIWKTVKYQNTNGKKSDWLSAKFDHLVDAKKLMSVLQKKEPFTGTIKKILDEK